MVNGWFDLNYHNRELEMRLRDEKRLALLEDLRLARRTRLKEEVRAVRRHVGVVLITAGEALAR